MSVTESQVLLIDSQRRIMANGINGFLTIQSLWKRYL